MANLSVEEPDALMCARPGLREPRVGNDPGPPSPYALRGGQVRGRLSSFRPRIGCRSNGRRELARSGSAVVAYTHPDEGYVCLRLRPIRVPFSRVFGTLIERRQFGTRCSGLASGSSRGRFRTGKGRILGTNSLASAEGRLASGPPEGFSSGRGSACRLEGRGPLCYNGKTLGARSVSEWSPYEEHRVELLGSASSFVLCALCQPATYSTSSPFGSSASP